MSRLATWRPPSTGQRKRLKPFSPPQPRATIVGSVHQGHRQQSQESSRRFRRNNQLAGRSLAWAEGDGAGRADRRTVHAPVVDALKAFERRYDRADGCLVRHNMTT